MDVISILTQPWCKYWLPIIATIIGGLFFGLLILSVIHIRNHCAESEKQEPSREGGSKSAVVTDKRSYKGTVAASDILAKIEKEEDVDCDGFIIEGNLDISSIKLSEENGKLVIKSNIIIMNSRFDGFVNFRNALFKQKIDFYYTVFNGEDKDGLSANFENATFSHFASPPFFMNVTFTHTANFENATFSRFAVFESTTFKGYANFGGAEFDGGANFRSAKFCEFSGDPPFANFVSAKFGGDVHFESATFSVPPTFRSAKFDCDAHFMNATFKNLAPSADFKEAIFYRNTDFREATFSGDANFSGVTFSRYANFGGAEFDDEANFSGVTFSGYANFWWAKFNGDANFSEVTFSGYANFWNVKFKGYVQFINAKFLEETARREERTRMFETARQQISLVNTLMTGGYFAIISLSSIKDSLNMVTWPLKWMAILFIISPMLCWLVSLINAYIVFLPGSWNPFKTRYLTPPADLNTRDFIEWLFLSDYLSSKIGISIWTSIAGFLLLVIIVSVYLGFFPSPPPQLMVNFST